MNQPAGKLAIAQRIRFENYWWGNYTPDGYFDSLPKRGQFDLLLQLLDAPVPGRAVLLHGPKGAGKTVLLKQCISRLLRQQHPARSICYLSMDTALYLNSSLQELAEHAIQLTKVGKNEALILMLDEVQYLANWDIQLKNLVSTQPKVTVLAAASLGALANSENDWATYIDVPPLSFYEYLNLKGKRNLLRSTQISVNEGPSFEHFEARDARLLNEAFLDFLNFGGFPQIAVNRDADPRPLFLRTEIARQVLQNDLPGLQSVRNVTGLIELFTLLAGTSGLETSYQQLSESLDCDKITLKRNLHYLVDAHLIRIVNRVGKTGREYQRNNYFKAVLTNPSLRTTVHAPMENRFDLTMAALVETAIWTQQPDFSGQLFYASWPGGGISMVQRNHMGKPISAAEITYSNRVMAEPNRLKDLVLFCRKHSISNPIVTTQSVTGFREIEGVSVFFMPAAEYCFLLGRSEMQRRRALILRAG